MSQFTYPEVFVATRFFVIFRGRTLFRAVGDGGCHAPVSPSMDNLANLPDPTDAALDKALRERFEKKQIYVRGVAGRWALGEKGVGLTPQHPPPARRGGGQTWTGDILVAVNPYCDLQLYSHAIAQKYLGQPLAELPPHIFGPRLAGGRYLCALAPALTARAAVATRAFREHRR